MRYVLGGGLAGLLWAFYHRDYTIVTDRLGWGVMGVDPLLWLHDDPLCVALCEDLLGLTPRAIERPIGYLSGERGSGLGPALVSWRELTPEEQEVVFLKKMVSWEMLRLAQLAGVSVKIAVPQRTLSVTTEFMRYLDIDPRLLVSSLVAWARAQATIIEHRVIAVMERHFALDAPPFSEHAAWKPYEHLVSTIPAPIFDKLWRGARHRRERFHYVPITNIISGTVPSFLRGEHCMIYDARRLSAVSRAARLPSGRVCYEITGALRFDDEEVQALYPAGEDAVFVYPYGRLIQDTEAMSPAPNITLLGRFAQWNHNVFVESILHEIKAAEVLR